MSQDKITQYLLNIILSLTEHFKEGVSSPHSTFDFLQSSFIGHAMEQIPVGNQLLLLAPRSRLSFGNFKTEI